VGRRHAKFTRDSANGGQYSHRSVARDGRVMHERSVAISLLDVITESLIRDADEAARATSVTVEVGALSGVVPEALRTAFASAIRGTDLADCAITLVSVPVVLHCERCDADVPAIATDDLRCERCRTPSISVVRGRELDVVSIEWKPDASTAANP
jgi:hydrogenase nickel incorporation protein HypA/HybF